MLDFFKKGNYIEGREDPLYIEGVGFESGVKAPRDLPVPGLPNCCTTGGLFGFGTSVLNLYAWAA